MEAIYLYIGTVLIYHNIGKGNVFTRWQFILCNFLCI